MNTTQQRNWLKRLREGRSHQPDTQETSVEQVNAATSYLDSLPPRRKGAFHLFLDTRHLSRMNLSKPVMLLTEASESFAAR
jgi:hypothetical protein